MMLQCLSLSLYELYNSFLITAMYGEFLYFFCSIIMCFQGWISSIFVQHTFHSVKKVKIYTKWLYFSTERFLAPGWLQKVKNRAIGKYTFLRLLSDIRPRESTFAKNWAHLAFGLPNKIFFFVHLYVASGVNTVTPQNLTMCELRNMFFSNTVFCNKSVEF